MLHINALVRACADLRSDAYVPVSLPDALTVPLIVRRPRVLTRSATGLMACGL